MAMTEEQRHELYTRLEEVIGMGAATTLMEGMPPVGWADVATKRDLEHLEEKLGSRIGRLELRVDHLDAGLGARIDQLEARLTAELHAALERSLREQSNRFLVGTGAILTLLLTAQELLGRV